MYVSLPSNTADFPGNTTSEYRVKLPYPIELQGDWEVALVEIQYPHSHDNIVATASDIAKMEENCFLINLPPAKELPVGMVLKFAISPGTYDTVQGLIENIHESLKNWDIDLDSILKINNMAVSRRKLKDYLDHFQSKNREGNGLLFLEYLENIHRVRVNVSADVSNIIFSPLLQYVLGLGTVRLVQIEQAQYLAKYPPDLSAGFNSLYVYCDLIQPQIVGNTLVPLLRAFAIEGKHGDYITKTFLSPHYAKLRTKTFDTVEISIRTDTNKAVKFNFGKVIVKLHLRKVSRQLT